MNTEKTLAEVCPAGQSVVEEQAKRAWTAPDILAMDISKATFNAGPTFLDTGAFS